MTSIAQPQPKTEAQAQALSDAQVFAESHQDDIGYPWLDPTTGELQLSAATAGGHDLLGPQAALAQVTTSVRTVSASYAKLASIADDVTRLQAGGVVDSDLIYATGPDYQNSRIVISVSGTSTALFHALAERYGTTSIALLVNPKGGPGRPATRTADFSPYYGGARISAPAGGCTDSFSWVIGSTVGNAMLTAGHCAPSGGNISIDQVVGTVKSADEENWDTTYGTRYYTGQNVYRGDVALTRLKSGLRSDPRIYRGGVNSGTSSAVTTRLLRYSYTGETVYLGGSFGGETGLYLINSVGINYNYSIGCGSNCWVRNVVLASRNYTPCVVPGDSGGSIFSTVTGGVRAVGTLSGVAASYCDILFTDIYNTYQALPGDVLLN